MKAPDLLALHEALRAFALTFPGAWEDHPWDEPVTKAGKKIFVFHGSTPNDPTRVGIGVKLTNEHAHALSYDWSTPTSYGLGKAGWVSCWFDAMTPAAPVDLLQDWIDESYRNIATKTLIRELDAREA